MKKIIAKIIFAYFIFISKILYTYAESRAPGVVCDGLPGCSDTVGEKSFFGFLGNLISSGIKYTAVLAVISLMLAGMMYLISGGEEDHVKKAKKWITWSLVGVLISTSAWAIINLANSFKIN